MTRNYYEILGVRQSATDAAILRAIQTARDQIATNASLSIEERAARMAEVQAASDALTIPAKRDQYDAALRLMPAGSGGAAAWLTAPRTWFIVLAIAALAGGLYWQYARAQTAQRLERERVAAEQQEAQRVKEIEERRLLEKQRLLDELRAQREADDKLRQESNEMRSAESQKKQYVTDDRFVPPSQYKYDSSRGDYENQRQMGAAAWQRLLEERKQQHEDEMNVQRARAEVDRQKRYLEQREREEQEARARRDPDTRSGR
jgi:curved DNA-binding protein CbpA